MQTDEPSPPERAKILVTVKTYPQLSGKHTETVCTAGVREGGRWVRLYPIAYRYLGREHQFRKYQWIEADIVRDTRDPRPESYRLAGDITPLAFLDTKDAWELRKRFVLGKVYYNLRTLVDEARDTTVFTSLAVFKPQHILSFTMVRDDSAEGRQRKQQALAEQLPETTAVRLADAVPFRFYYTFEDQRGKRSTLQILDWEIYQLCRKLMRKYGASKRDLYPHLYEKYVAQLTARRDVYFFLGTNKYWHIRRSNNPFMIVGIFYAQWSRKANGAPSAFPDYKPEYMVRRAPPWWHHARLLHLVRWVFSVGGAGHIFYGATLHIFSWMPRDWRVTLDEGGSVWTAHYIAGLVAIILLVSLVSICERLLDNAREIERLRTRESSQQKINRIANLMRKRFSHAGHTEM